MKFLFSATLILSTCTLFAGKDPISPEKSPNSHGKTFILQTEKVVLSNMMVQNTVIMKLISRPSSPQHFNVLSWDGRIRFALGKNMVLALTYN